VAYAPLEDSFWSHRKGRRAGRLLAEKSPAVAGLPRGLRKLLADGAVAGLWSWALTNAPDGVIIEDDQELEEALGWDGEPGVLISVLVEAGWLDREGETVRIHGWEERSGSLKRAAKMRERRALEKQRTADTSDPRVQHALPLAEQSRSDATERNASERDAKDLAPRPPSGGSPPAPVLVFPADGKAKTWELTSALLAELQVDFESVDVLAEAKLALAWVKAKPDRRKTVVGYRAFLTSWLSRAKDSGRFARSNANGPPGPQLLSERGQQNARNAQAALELLNERDRRVR
jgi:hypothetical protein